MKFAIITSIFMISALGEAAPRTPYIDQKYNSVVIEDSKNTKVYLSDCSIDKTAVKYFGERPVCTQSLTCRRGEQSNVAIVEPSQIKTSIYCAISSASAGCKSKTWQACMIDITFPDNLSMNCANDTPGATKPGCPNVDLQGPSQNSAAEVR